MTTTTPSPTRSRTRRNGGFTLVEMMVGSTLAAFILAGILTVFLFLGRSGANVRNYSDMEAQARKALETFAEDVRQASAIAWASNVSVTLTVNSANVGYAYSSSTGIFSRTDASGTRTLISGITEGSFVFRSFNIAGTELPLATAANLTAAGSSTKQLQISLEASRSNVTVVNATNAVLSARFILRNKIVTA
ncbi:MAG: prepilin-type N-terminal cleavage/methylation domain-containing protein [Opitutaceae bacterium]|nr:prepilin-type N-terminal cleavage/methylation domain-containing protein [Opitutaceae bacterium]